METTITAKELRHLEGQNGLALLDCNIPPLELLEQLNRAFTHGGILLDRSELKDVLSFQHDGKVDLLLPFRNAKVDPAKIVIWQVLTHRECRAVFLSDYFRYELYDPHKEENPQQTDLTERGRQRFIDTADPTIPHSYDWYVTEAYNTPERQLTSGLTLEDAIRHYAASKNDVCQLGVTKDNSAAVDLVIRWKGRERLSKSRLTLDSFKDDPVVADAVDRLQQMLEERPAVGRITFASGERWIFTDPQRYLQTVREELPYQAATGLRCETLTSDPAIRKAVDGMLCDLYGEENPHQTEDYGGADMTMGPTIQMGGM